MTSKVRANQDARRPRYVRVRLREYVLLWVAVVFVALFAFYFFYELIFRPTWTPAHEDPGLPPQSECFDRRGAAYCCQVKPWGRTVQSDGTWLLMTECEKYEKERHAVGSSGS